MDGFNWNVDGETVRIIFSLIRNARWVGAAVGVRMAFDFGDYDIYLGRDELEDEDGNMGEYEQELWSMLLQSSGLDAS